MWLPPASLLLLVLPRAGLLVRLSVAGRAAARAPAQCRHGAGSARRGGLPAGRSVVPVAAAGHVAGLVAGVPVPLPRRLLLLGWHSAPPCCCSRPRSAYRRVRHPRTALRPRAHALAGRAGVGRHLGAHHLPLRLYGDTALGTLLPGGLLAALVWLVRYGSTQLDERSRAGGAAQADWRGRLPVSLLAGAAAAVLACSSSCCGRGWCCGCAGTAASRSTGWCSATHGPRRCWRCCWRPRSASRCWPAASPASSTCRRCSPSMRRGSRAPTGASNGQRFGAAEMLAPLRRSALSVAEPVAGDGISLNAYYDPKVLAPLHLINVTLNLTVDPAEQLVQRDRKGKPFAWRPAPAACRTARPFCRRTTMCASRSTGSPIIPPAARPWRAS